MFDAEIEIPILERLRVNFARSVKKGGERARKIVVVRTRDRQRDANGKQLPAPKVRGEGPARRSLYRTGETIDGMRVGPVRNLVVRVTPDGYHTAGKTSRVVRAVERARGRKLTASAKQKLRKAASRATAKRKGRGGRGGVRGGASPLALILFAQQVGAVGGKKAGYRAPITVMDLGEAEATEVRGVMESDVDAQVSSLEASGSALTWRTARQVLRGRR